MGFTKGFMYGTDGKTNCTLLILLSKLWVWRKWNLSRPFTPYPSFKNHTTSISYRHRSP